MPRNFEGCHRKLNSCQHGRSDEARSAFRVTLYQKGNSVRLVPRSSSDFDVKLPRKGAQMCAFVSQFPLRRFQRNQHCRSLKRKTALMTPGAAALPLGSRLLLDFSLLRLGSVRMLPSRRMRNNDHKLNDEFAPQSYAEVTVVKRSAS